jgi:DNA-binding PadR family transcriptional regulator
MHPNSGLVLEKEIVNTLCERFLKVFMDVLIMLEMRNSEISGYDVLSHFHEKFNFVINVGTVYSVLYSMERDGLIIAKKFDKKRVYTLTPKGEATIKVIDDSSKILESFLASLLCGG